MFIPEKYLNFRKFDNLFHGNNSCFLNPVALRKAKIAYNFGQSECNRVKLRSFFKMLQKNGKFSGFGGLMNGLLNWVCIVQEELLHLLGCQIIALPQALEIVLSLASVLALALAKDVKVLCKVFYVIARHCQASNSILWVDRSY